LWRLLPSFLKICPHCHSARLIRWGYYKRFALPARKNLVPIQRIFCKDCCRTFSLLPSFLLARRSRSVHTLEAIISIITKDDDWRLSPEIEMELSTAYRWIRLFSRQARDALPIIRGELVKLDPSKKVCQEFDAVPEQLGDYKILLLQRFLSFSRQLLQKALQLADDQADEAGLLFSFINFLLAHKTGKALLCK
jgi:hypothetical protein